MSVQQLLAPYLPSEIIDLIDFDGLGGCWLWKGYLTDKGYGRYLLKRVHNIMLEALDGPMPEGMVPDHLCLVKRCSNPDHLDTVTNQENLRRGIRASQTHCIYGHEYTDDNTVWQVYKGYSMRSCRTCRKEKRQKR